MRMCAAACHSSAPTGAPRGPISLLAGVGPPPGSPPSSPSSPSSRPPDHTVTPSNPAPQTFGMSGVPAIPSRLPGDFFPGWKVPFFIPHCFAVHKATIWCLYTDGNAQPATHKLVQFNNSIFERIMLLMLYPQFFIQREAPVIKLPIPKTGILYDILQNILPLIVFGRPFFLSKQIFLSTSSLRARIKELPQ